MKNASPMPHALLPDPNKQSQPRKKNTPSQPTTAQPTPSLRFRPSFPQPHLSFPLRSLNTLPSPLPPCITVSKNMVPAPPASNEPMPANNPFLP